MKLKNCGRKPLLCEKIWNNTNVSVLYEYNVLKYKIYLTMIPYFISNAATSR